MTANELIPSLEGLVGSGLRGAKDLTGKQACITWLECMKVILRSSGLRNATDWRLLASGDAVAAAGTALDSTGGTVYGVLIDHIFDVSTDNLYWMLHNVTHTLDRIQDVGVSAEGATAETGAMIAGVDPNATSGTTPRFITYLNPAGLVFTEAIFASAVGDEDNAATALDVRVFVVLRETIEVQVV